MLLTIEIPGVEILVPIAAQHEKILPSEAVVFLAGLQRRFNAKRKDLLERRRERQQCLDAGEKPDFLTQTRDVHLSEWTVAPLPPDILDRRVEITGPVNRKMIINALNSGAKVFMADFEDSSTSMASYYRDRFSISAFTFFIMRANWWRRGADPIFIFRR